MTTLEAQAILADAPNIVARAIQGGYARRRLAEEIAAAEKMNKGIRVFTPEHRAKLRDVRLRFCHRNQAE